MHKQGDGRVSRKAGPHVPQPPVSEQVDRWLSKGASGWERGAMHKRMSKPVVGWLMAQLEGKAVVALSHGLWERERNVASEKLGGPLRAGSP